MQPLASIDGVTLEQLAEASASGLDSGKFDTANSGFFLQLKDKDGLAFAAYVGLLQAALQRRVATLQAPLVPFQEFVALSAFALLRGEAPMLTQYKVAHEVWNGVCAFWRLQIMTKPEHRSFGMLLQAEIQRLSTGGEPRPVTIQQGAPATLPPPNVSAQAPGQAGQPGQPGQASQPGQPGQAVQPTQGQAFVDQAGQAANAVVGAAAMGFGALGSAISQALMSAGSKVLVQWTDGNKYPGIIAQMAQGQALVTMSDGRQLWIPNTYLTAL
jgi:hypothetical protein